LPILLLSEVLDLPGTSLRTHPDRVFQEPVNAKERSQSDPKVAGFRRFVRPVKVELDEKVTLDPGMAENVHGGPMARRLRYSPHQVHEVVHVVTSHPQVERLQDVHDLLPR
jgi:hypothetical protein